jgi:PAS domain S-box-containing protein
VVLKRDDAKANPMRSPVDVSRRLFPFKTTAAGTACAAVAVSAALLIPFRTDPKPILLVSAVILLFVMGFQQVWTAHAIRERFALISMSLDVSHRELESVFDMALEAMFILDDELICLDANQAAADLLGLDRARLVGQSIAEFSADRSRGVHLSESGPHRGRTELVRADGGRVVAEFSSSPHMLPGRHLLMLRDATAQIRATEANSRTLALAKSSFLEAHALRNATLALASSVQLNPLLDSVLETFFPLIPCDVAQVLLVEDAARFYVAREISAKPEKRGGFQPPGIIEQAVLPMLIEVVERRRSVLVPDTRSSSDWRDLPASIVIRSWLGVPLLIGREVVGVLSLAHKCPDAFSSEHLRLASSMAIPVSLAIQNARLYERGEIFRTELERCLSRTHGSS